MSQIIKNPATATTGGGKRYAHYLSIYPKAQSAGAYPAWNLSLAPIMTDSSEKFTFESLRAWLYQRFMNAHVPIMRVLAASGCYDDMVVCGVGTQAASSNNLLINVINGTSPYWVLLDDEDAATIYEVVVEI